MFEDQEKTFLEHLFDLRNVIIKSASALGVGVLIVSCFTRDLLAVLRWPLIRVCVGRKLDPDKLLIALGVTDPLNIFMDIALFGGMILSAPFILYFIGSFLLPALTPRERKMILPTFVAGGFLFITGVVFCYFLVLPQTLAFFIDFNGWFHFQTQWTIQYYIDFVVQTLLAFGFAFELPLVILLLAKLGLVNQAFLRHYRRHAILILFIATCCISPATDLFNLSLLFVPMYFLYELSIFLAAGVEKKRSSE